MTQTTSQQPPPAVADFGPDQGAITAFNLRAAQVAIAVAGLAGLWVAVLSRNLLVMVAAFFLWTLPCALAALVRVPLTGKYLDQHIGPWLRWRWWKLTGKAKRQPISGATVWDDKVASPEQAPPPELAQVALLDYTDPHGRHTGLVHDRWADTYTVVMRVEANRPNVGGLDHLDQTLRGWERVLRGIAEPGAGIRRFQWLLVAAPDDGTRLHADFETRAVVRDGELAGMYDQLTREAGPTNTIHETYLAVQVAATTANDEDMLSGSAFAASAAAAVRAAKRVAHKLAQTSYVVVRETLEPAELGRLVHLLYCPQNRSKLEEQRSGVPYSLAWPRRADRDWSNYNTDGAMHRVYELAWPTEPVYAAFLDALAVLPGTAHALSVVYQPLAREVEIQRAEQRRSTAEVSDDRRRKWGFLKPRAKERQEDRNEGYIGQLLGGAEAFRVTAWAMVSAFVGPGDLDDLANYARVDDKLLFSPSKAVRRRMAAAELALTTAATDARVTLVPRDGVHAQAFAHVAPFCMGTEGVWL